MTVSILVKFFILFKIISTDNQFVEDALHSRLVDARAEGAEFGEELEEVERHVTVVARLHLVHHRKHVVAHVVDECVGMHVFLFDKDTKYLIVLLSVGNWVSKFT